MQRCALSEIEDALEAEPSEELSQVRSGGPQGLTPNSQAMHACMHERRQGVLLLHADARRASGGNV